MTIILDTGDRVIPLLNQILLIAQQLEKTMATASDEIAKLTADFTAAATRVNTDLANLNNQVTTIQQQMAALQQQLANQQLDTATQAAADSLDASINALDVPAPVPVPPAPPSS